ncbi:MAG: biotin--[acetyl-CoA-carboxylase] ligase [Desulfovibrio sp.]|nr:biotin--[acetyl-CoA-carboxylase] ligase [Desulfovibrio sp.]
MKSCDTREKTRDTISIYSFEETDSVLDVAYRLALNGHLKPWDSVLSMTQRSGRGQLRRTWFSPKGNLYAALVLPFVPPFSNDAAAPATGYLLAKALNTMGYAVQIKWPNDLIAHGAHGPRKLGGILLEERGDFLFAGIGINLLSSPSDDLLRRDHVFPATSLLSAFAKKISPQKFWQSLVRTAIKAYKEDDKFDDTWHQNISAYLLWLGASVCLCMQKKCVEGLLQGVGPHGGVLLSSQGRTEEYTSGSIMLL